MPTYAVTLRFERDLRELTREERALFAIAIRKLVADLRVGSIRAGLRVRHVEGTRGVFELTWHGDGRATFEYGESIRAGEPHIVWRRVGSHDIFKSP